MQPLHSDAAAHSLVLNALGFELELKYFITHQDAATRGRGKWPQMQYRYVQAAVDVLTNTFVGANGTRVTDK